jgi:hypothetical protein
MRLSRVVACRRCDSPFDFRLSDHRFDRRFSSLVRRSMVGGWPGTLNRTTSPSSPSSPCSPAAARTPLGRRRPAHAASRARHAPRTPRVSRTPCSSRRCRDCSARSCFTCDKASPRPVDVNGPTCASVSAAVSGARANPARPCFAAPGRAPRPAPRCSQLSPGPLPARETGRQPHASTVCNVAGASGPRLRSTASSRAPPTWSLLLSRAGSMRVDASYATPRGFSDASPIPMFLSGGASSNLAPSVPISRADICYADKRVTDVACPLAPLRAAWLAAWCSSSSPGCSFSSLSAADALARSVPASRPRQATRRPRQRRRRPRCERRTTSACSPRTALTWISAHLQRTPALAPQKWYLIPSLRPALHR